MSEARAVIWDMDGVIVDTARYHFQSWQFAFHKRGVSFTREDFRRNFGRRNDAIVRTIMGENVPPDEIRAIARDKEENFRQIVAPHVKALPGAVSLIKALREQGFKMAIASSAPPENIKLLTSGLGIIDYFQQVVSGREVAESKPSPQLFLLAAQKLEVPPARCVVIEDAVAGVAAAKRAGMQCIAVTTTNHRESLVEADLIVDSLKQVTVADVEGLIGA
ncbi:MAG: HAD family phosphatase [Chloroflexi bacterium]|nr:HAD family phosphatase [Chloroflexota bacterium]